MGEKEDGREVQRHMNNRGRSPEVMPGGLTGRKTVVLKSQRDDLDQNGQDSVSLRLNWAHLVSIRPVWLRSSYRWAAAVHSFLFNSGYIKGACSFIN